MFHFTGGAAKKGGGAPETPLFGKKAGDLFFFLFFIYMKHLQYKNVNFDSS